MKWLKDKFAIISNAKINGEMLFFVALSISLLASFIINTTFMPYLPVKYLNRLNYLAIAILILKIYLFDNYKVIQYISITIALVLGFMSWRKTNNSFVMIMIAFIMGAKDVDFNKIVKTYFNINFVLILLVITYSIMGIIRNFVFFRSGMYRLSLGVDYPTDLAAYVFYLILAYCFTHFRKLGLRDWIGFIVISGILYTLTNARLDSILILLVIPVMMISRVVQFDNDRKHTYLRYIVDHYWALTIILPYAYILLTIYYNYHNRILLKVNNLLSGRLWFGNLGLHKYGVTLFGQKIVEHGWGGLKGYNLSKNDISQYFFIDSTYIRLMVIYGLLVGILIVGILFIISIRETIRQNYVVVSVMLLIAISSLIDQHMLEITYNVFLLAFLAKLEQNQVGGFQDEQTVLS